MASSGGSHAAGRTECNFCGAYNPQGLNRCDMCGVAMRRGAVQGLSDVVSPPAAPAGPSACPLCSVQRKNSAVRCEFCGYNFVNPGAPPPSAAVRRPWVCGQCTVQNTDQHELCHVCGAPPPAWKCVGCTLMNEAFLETCTTCRTARPSEQGAMQFAAEIPLRILHPEGEPYDDMHAEVLGRLDAVEGLCTQVGSYLSRSTLMLTNDEPAFFTYLTKEIGDEYVQQLLATKGLINFTPRAHVLPLRTVGDGNCLLHAVCMGMWALDDRDRTMRCAMAASLSEPSGAWVAGVRERWWADTQRVLARLPEGFAVVGDPDSEWDHVVRLPSLSVGDLRPDGRPLGIGGISLLAVHVYVLAQIVMRPIVMHGDDSACADAGDSMAGIFLPSTVAPAACARTPLQLAYTPGHFTLLAPVASAASAAAGPPLCALCTSAGVALPLRFEDPAVPRATLLAQYLDLERLPNGGEAAQIAVGMVHEAVVALDDCLAGARMRFETVRVL